MRDEMNGLARELDVFGYAIVSGVLSPAVLASLSSAVQQISSDLHTAGMRDLVEKSPAIRELASSATIRALVESIAGRQARLVRSILFVKDDNTNWGVSWHQDLSIAVRSQVELEGYSGWTVKEGIVHVQPPREILENILTVRLHLDPADDSNGALLVAPASHRLGRIPADEAAGVAKRLGSRTCEVRAGDALFLRPLILHASSKSVSKRPRRVIHLEFASGDLPRPLEWRESA